MGLFGSFFGSDQRKDVRNATKQANQQLTKSATAARTQMNQGIDQQLASLQGGYTGATDRLNTGYDRARTDLTGAYGNAESAINTQLDYSKQLLDPYITSGNKAQSRYDTALGLNGAAEQRTFADEYAASDPWRELNEDMANKALQRLLNANGHSSDGRLMLASARANQERGSTDYNAYLDRLEGQGQRGGQYALILAGYANYAGSTVANLRAGLGDRLSTNEVNRGTALGNLDYGYGQDQGTIQANRGAQNANLTYGLGQQLAGNRINLGNAVADSRSTGINNLIGLGSTVIGGFKPIPLPGGGSASAFGNMAKSMSGGGWM